MTRSRLLSLVLLSAFLAGCASEPPSDAPPSASPAVVESPAPASSAPPVAADGTDVRSCRDGGCEVRVVAEDEVPLPERSGLGAIQVVAIDATTVSMVLPLTGTDFESDGGCSPFITGPGAGTSGFVTLSCAAGDRSTVNKLTIEVRDIADEAAILRVETAP